MRALWATAALAAAVPAFAASESSCPRDALVMLSAVRAARAELENSATGTDKDRCKAWRGQVAVLQRASAFYARCQTGAERDRSVANANAGVHQYQNALNAQCGGR